MPTPQSSREAPTSGTGREEEGGCSKWRSHPKVQMLARTQAGVTGPFGRTAGTAWGERKVLRGAGRSPAAQVGPAGLSSAPQSRRPATPAGAVDIGGRVPPALLLTYVTFEAPPSTAFSPPGGLEAPHVPRLPASQGSTTPRAPVSALHTLASATDWRVDRDQVSSSTAQSAMDCGERHSPA